MSNKSKQSYVFSKLFSQRFFANMQTVFVCLTKVFLVFLRQEVVKRKSSSGAKQKSSKILVRNVPFEATQKELRELFGTFGELKTVRLPKKLSGTGPHRGFAFIDFLTKQDAKVSKDKITRAIL